MTKLQIISKLWSIVFDLVLLANGQSNKTLQEIEKDIDLVEFNCRKYADVDDDELPENKYKSRATERHITVLKLRRRKPEEE